MQLPFLLGLFTEDFYWALALGSMQTGSGVNNGYNAHT